MRQTRIVLGGICALLVTLSASGSAQGGRRGGGSGRRGGPGDAGGRGAASVTALRDEDLRKVDPARVLLDQAKVLKLSDGQKQSLDSVVTRYEWNTHRFAKEVDSLVTVSRRERGEARRTEGGAPPDSGDTDVRVTHRALLDALQSVRDEFDADALHSTERLNDDQRKQAIDLLQEARTKLESLLSKA